jgi:predicted N-acetyltransferase YhbS
MDIAIRKIKTEDLYSIECMTKKAFWNLNMPGCDEHYLVHRIWNEQSGQRPRMQKNIS